MPKLRRLSGSQVILALKDFGFSIAGQRGSHIKLARIEEGRRQTLTIPNHKEIDTGTLRAIYRQASLYVHENELKRHFYSE
jgi:predicted RNA binding protein YcfA (HicA-like mRNA interferase family)